MTHEIAALRVAASNIINTVESSDGVYLSEHIAQEMIGFVVNGHLSALLDKSEKLGAINAALLAERENWVEICKRAEAAEAELAQLRGIQTPIAWTDEEELVEMRTGTCGTFFNADHIDTSSGEWFPLYLTPQPLTPVITMPARYSFDASAGNLRMTTNPQGECCDYNEVIAAVIASGCLVKDS